MIMKSSKAYLYARVSSEAQAERGTSIPSQLELIRAYAKRSNIQIIKEFIDEAQSATSDNRPQFQEMISLCRANPYGIDTILVWKLSRFARNRTDSVVYKKLLSKEGIRVLSVSEPIEDSPEGRILEGMIEIIDNYYSENLSKETMRGLRQAALQGYHCGGNPPYGYCLKSVQVGNSVKKVWGVHPKEAEAIRIIYNMHANGSTYESITKKLEELDHKPRSKSSWSKSSLSEILRRRCYSGIHYYNTRKSKDLGKRVFLRQEKDPSEWIEVKVPQLVDDETFNAVKQKMGKRKFKNLRKTTHQILSGLIICGKCGQPYFIRSYYMGKYPYYRCSTKMKKGLEACDNRNIRGDELDQAILEQVRETIFSEENLKKYRTLITESVEDERKELQDLLKRLENKQQELEKKKSIYYEGIETGKISFQLLGERLKQLAEEKEKTQEVILEAEDRLNELPEAKQYDLTKEELLRIRKDLESLIEEAEPTQKHQFLTKFIQSITVHPDRIIIEYVPPMFSKKKSQDKSQGFSTIKLEPATMRIWNCQKLILRIVLAK